MPALYHFAAGARSAVAATDMPLRGGRSGHHTAGLSPDHPSRSAPSPYGARIQLTEPPVPQTAFAIPPSHVRGMGPIGKLAGGNFGHGHRQPLGAPLVPSGQENSLAAGIYEPLENAPATRANWNIRIPKKTPVGRGVSISGRQFMPTYKAQDFTPAQRFFSQARSSRPGMGAQSQYPPIPGGRPLVPSVQPQTLARMSPGIRRALPAAQHPVGQYTIGYPTRASVAARLGAGGPVAVLGGGY